ncbi:MAG: RNase adapter RapZ [Eubacteriales bacterium]|nr:RNase adapter RapZ [Eubacteriales bacterium]MDD4324406.1 RNase adapter RapZ [Eubacteriales bacterium]MDD4541648.1 RNase adapter RapZ [Eubacteriales bacterium]
MEIVIITGLSGSGKTSAANYFEDMGYFVIDNLPPQLSTEILDVLADRDNTDEGVGSSRLALVMDMRNPYLIEKLVPALEDMKQKDIDVSVLFLESSEKSLISRYKQSRRDHPLSAGRSLIEAIRLERELMLPVRGMATEIIDTSSLSLSELRDALFRIFMDKKDASVRITIFLQSFGFKYGIPVDCDNVVDVRFLPNPYYVDDLRDLCGLDQPVKDYIDQMCETDEFLRLQKNFYDFTLPLYIREGKARLHIGVGCTGGRHRSVHLVERMASLFPATLSRVVIDHRDIERDLKEYGPPAML